MKTFDKEHEEFVVKQLLSHAMYEAQMMPEHLQGAGETFDTNRAAFLMKVLSKATARGLTIIERIAEDDLSGWFQELFDEQLEEARVAFEMGSSVKDKTEN